MVNINRQYLNNCKGWNETLLLVFESLLMDIPLSLCFSSVSILTADMIGVIIILLFIRGMDKKTLLHLGIYKIIAVAFVLLVYYGNIQTYGAPYFIGGSDDLHFEDTASLFLKNNYKWPWDYPIETNCSGMYWLLSQLMKISGGEQYYSTFAFRVLNIDFLMAIGVIAYKIARYSLRLEKTQAKLIMLSVIFFPNAIYLSSYVFRDTLCCLIIVIAYAICEDITRNSLEPIICRNRFLSTLYILVLAFFAYWLRKELLFLMLVVFCISFAGDRITRNRLLIMFMAAVFALVILVRFHAISFILAKASRYVLYHYQYIAEKNSSALYSKIFLTPVFPLGICYRTLYGFVFPLPTGIIQFFNIFNNGLTFVNFIVSLGSCYQVVMLPFLISGLRRVNQISLVFWAEFLSIILTTFTFRHFIMIYPFMFVIIFNEYYHFSIKKRQRYFWLGLTVLCVLAAVYILYKFV